MSDNGFTFKVLEVIASHGQKVARTRRTVESVGSALRDFMQVHADVLRKLEELNKRLNDAKTAHHLATDDALREIGWALPEPKPAKEPSEVSP